MSGKKKIVFIINPVSGVGKQKCIEEELGRWLDYRKFEQHIAYTEYAHHATEIARSAVENGMDIVVAVGGDGSINDVVNGIVDSTACMGVIPVGSGNGLARHLGISLSVKNAIQTLNKMQVEKIDTIDVNGFIYASIAGIGFDALVAKEMTTKKIRGLQAYSRIVLLGYPLYKPHTYVLDIDGVEIEREALFICFANSNQFGYNATVAPNAELNDGLIDVCMVQKVPIPFLPIAVQQLYSKNFEKSNFVEIIKAKKITVFNNITKATNIDGEYMEFDEKLEFVIKPNSLKVLV